MMRKSTGFSFYNDDGREVRYPAGRLVPEDIVKALGLEKRGLVEPLPKPIKKAKRKAKLNEST